MLCLCSPPCPSTGQTVWHPCSWDAGWWQQFPRGMSHAAPASHPSFLIVRDTWISTKQAAPVHDNCNSRLLAVCSPESLCGRTVGAACMLDIPVRGGTLASLVQDVSMCAGTDSSSAGKCMLLTV